MKKSWIALFLAIMLVMSCTAVASAVTFGNEGELAEEAYQPVSDGDPVPVHIAHYDRVGEALSGDDKVDDNWFTRAIEEKLNIDLIYDEMIPSTSYYETLSLLVASGELPDAFVVNDSLLQELAEADMLYDMTEIYDTYASDFLKDIYNRTGSVIFDNITFDGKLLALPRSETGDSSAAMVYIRKDWLDAVGLDEPQTLDDVVEIARAFKNNDPDGNGVDDTWGFGVQANFYRQSCGATASAASLEGVFHAMKSYPSLFYWNDDHTEVLYGGIQPETKKALAFIADLVKEGLVQKNFATMSNDEVIEAALSGKCGIAMEPWHAYLGYDMGTDGVIWNCYAAPLDEDGLYSFPMCNPSSMYVVVMKDAPKEVAEAVMKILNLQAYTWTGSMDPLTQAREEYNDPTLPLIQQMRPFVVNLTPYDYHSSLAGMTQQYFAGEITKDELPAEIQGHIEKYIKLMSEPYNGDFAAYFTSDDFIPSVTNYMVFLDSCLHIYERAQEGIKNMVPAATFNVAASESWHEYGTSLTTMQSEYFTKIALGEADIDAFDEFVDLWLTLGGADALKEIQEIASPK